MREREKEKKAERERERERKLLLKSIQHQVKKFLIFVP